MPYSASEEPNRFEANLHGIITGTLKRYQKLPSCQTDASRNRPVPKGTFPALIGTIQPSK